MSDRSYLTHLHSCLWNIDVVSALGLALIVALLQKIRKWADGDASDHTEKAEADLVGFEAMARSAEDKREGGVEEEAQSVQIAII